MAVMDVSVVPAASLTLLIGTRALPALQSTQEEGGDVSRRGHEAGEELLPALCQLCCLHGGDHLRHLEQAPPQGCDGSCTNTHLWSQRWPTQPQLSSLSLQLKWLMDRRVSRAPRGGAGGAAIQGN